MATNSNFANLNSSKVASMWPSLHALADEGSLFIASSTSVAAGQAAGTAIATTSSVVDDAATASSTHAQNVPVMYLGNLASTTDGTNRCIYPLYLRMTINQVPTSATAWSYAIRADSVPRYTSGGTKMTPVNVNTASGNTSLAQIYFGAVVTTNLPSTNQRVLSSGQVQPTIPVTRDVWIFTFGDMTMPSSILTASAGKNINIPCGPMVLGPGWNLALEMWGASNAAAPSWEFEFCYAERGAGQ